MSAWLTPSRYRTSIVPHPTSPSRPAGYALRKSRRPMSPPASRRAHSAAAVRFAAFTRLGTSASLPITS